MAGMFDAFAKRAARRAAADSLHSADSRPHGVSRRRLVAGAAWTAPALALTTASNAWAVGSTGGLGQSCGNLGQGNCNNPYRCNGNFRQCNGCREPNICGGEGASCCDDQPVRPE